MQQIPMDLSFRSAQDRANFFISISNQLAADWIDRWPDWPGQIQGLKALCLKPVLQHFVADSCLDQDCLKNLLPFLFSLNTHYHLLRN